MGRDMVRIGFTGARIGMTRLQRQMLETLLYMYPPDEVDHGDCIGADEEFHNIVRKMFGKDVTIIGHPPTNPKYRAFCIFDEIFPERPYLERNRDIVDSSKFLLGAPYSKSSVLRSGTWSTIRYAKSILRPHIIIFGDGTVQRVGEWIQSQL